MDSVVSPATAIAIGELGGLGVLDLEGLWTRYENPEPLLEEIAALPAGGATARMQQIYSEPIKPELITARIAEIRAAGVTVAGALSPQRTQEHYQTVVDAGVDVFVIRGTTVSAEHVSKTTEPLNLKKFIYELDVPVIVGGAATYTAALRARRAPRSASTPRWRPRSRTSPEPVATTSTSRVVATCTSSPTADSARAATSSRRSASARMR
jgi:IMP dehydrogenase